MSSSDGEDPSRSLQKRVSSARSIGRENSEVERSAGMGTLLKHWTGQQEQVDEKQKKICEDSGLDSLLNLARMPHVKVQGLAMALINSLREGDNGEISVDTEEGFRPLVELTKFTEEEVQREAVWSLAILASNSSCQARIEQEVGWHNFRKYAASPIPEIQAGTAILLGNLALERTNQENIILKGVPLLMGMLKESKDPKVRRAVVTALSNVSIIEGFGAKEIWLTSGLELVMPFIEQEDDPQLQIGALNTVANLCNHDTASDLKAKVAKLGGIGRLVPLLDAKDEMIVKLTAMTIANMATDDGHKQIMHELGIEEPLIRLLDSRDEEVQLGVSMAINVLADSQILVADFRKRQAAEPLKELIQLTKDRDISKEAREALIKISPNDVPKLKNRKDSSSSISGSESSSYYSSSEESKSGSRRTRSRSNTGTGSKSGTGSESDDAAKQVPVRKPSVSKSESRSVSASASASGSDSDDGNDKAKILEQERLQREEKERIIKAETLRKNQEQEQLLREAEAANQTSELDSLKQKVAEVDEDALRKEQERKMREEERRRKEEEDDARRKREEQDRIKAEQAKADELRRKREEDDRTRLQAEKRAAEEAAAKTEVARKSQQMSEVPAANGRSNTNIRRSVSSGSTSSRHSEPAPRAAESQPVALRAPEDVRQSGSQALNGKAPVRKDSMSSLEDEGEDLPPDPNDPAIALVDILLNPNHVPPKKGITKDALRELERYASRGQRERLAFGSDIISILVYMSYFYSDTEYPDIIALVLYLLAILARNNVRNQLAIRRARGGDQIIRLVSSIKEPVQRNAALALGAYALNNAPIQTEVGKSIPVLVRLLDGPQTPAPTRRAVAAALASLADNNRVNQNIIVSAGGLKAAITLQPTDKLFAQNALQLVAALVSRNTNVQDSVLLDYPKFLTDLVHMVSNSSGNVVAQVNASNTLVELSKKNNGIQRSLYLHDSLGKLVPVLSTAGVNDQVILNVLYLLYSIVRVKKSSKAARSDLAKRKINDVLQPLRSSKNRDIADEAEALYKYLNSR